MTEHNARVDPYGGNPPHVIGSDTSLSAREAIRSRAQNLRERVLEMLRARPMTDNEMQLEGNILAATQCPRRVELCEVGLVCDSGQRRRTLRNRLAVVWQIHRGDECTCRHRPQRQINRPQTHSTGPGTSPSPETMRASLANLSALYRASPEMFGPQLVEVLRWLRGLSS